MQTSGSNVTMISSASYCCRFFMLNSASLDGLRTRGTSSERLLPTLFHDRDPLIGRVARDHFADGLQLEIFGRLEVQARLAHVELLPRIREGLLELRELPGIGVRAHQVERAKALV